MIFFLVIDSTCDLSNNDYCKHKRWSCGFVMHDQAVFRYVPQLM